MSRYLSAEEVEKENLETLGPSLGPVYHELCNECAWLHIKWHQYLVLFGTKPERIDLLNRSASLFFQIVQNTLWQDTLLHLTRLTDPPQSVGKDNLTVQRLPPLIRDPAFRAEIENLVSAAIKSTAFARDWRNRHFAHQDLTLALMKGPVNLAPASRKQVKDALRAVSRVLQRISETYFKADMCFDMVSEPNDAESLLYVIRDGVEAEEKRERRHREGNLDPEDLLPPRAI